MKTKRAIIDRLHQTEKNGRSMIAPTVKMEILQKNEIHRKIKKAGDQ